MKRYVWRAALAALTAMFLFSSCSPELNQYKGGYSFKTSGWVDVFEDGLRISERLVTVRDSIPLDSLPWGGSLPVIDSVYTVKDTTYVHDTVTVTLANESGQMNVVVQEQDENMMVITVNILNGAVLSFTAKADKDALTLIPKERYINLSLTNQFNLRMPVTVSGEGKRYENMLLFKLKYEGSSVINGVTYTLIGSNVECVAEKNED